ncbi:hypothetical protein BGZ76_004538, partial [Entomortierella beljakovae]
MTSNQNKTKPQAPIMSSAPIQQPAEESLSEILVLEHREWALNRNSNQEHVSFPTFVIHFAFYDKTDAHSAFSNLLRYGRINQIRLKGIKQGYEYFKTNKEDLFWSRRLEKKSSEITVRDASVKVQEAGFKQVEINLFQQLKRNFKGAEVSKVTKDVVTPIESSTSSEPSSVASTNVDPDRRSLDEDYDSHDSSDVNLIPWHERTPFPMASTSTLKRKGPDDHALEKVRKYESGHHRANGLPILEEDRNNRDSTPPPQIPHAIATTVNLEGSAFWKMLGMESTWTTKEGVNLLLSIEDANEAIMAVTPNITLCMDNVADFCYDSELQDSMNDEAFCLALDSLPVMPCLPAIQSDLLNRIFEGDVSWEEISDRIDDLMKVPKPVPALNSRTAFASRGAISSSIKEREYFRDYVVELLRGALSVYGIPYAWGEVYVPAVAFRKGNEMTGTGRGKFADGVSDVAGHQIFLSESGQLYRATTSKDQGDKLKLKRMLRDLMNYTILEMTKCKDKVSPGLTVFGSRTFKDTTELIAMDYKGVYRTYCLGSFKVVTEAEDAKKLLECFEMCLRFALTVKEQIDERSGAGRLSDIMALKLTKAARRVLIPTTITPIKQQQQQQPHPQPQQQPQHQHQHKQQRAR